MARLKVSHEQIGVQQNSGEKIVEVVGHSAGQATYRFQFLRLPIALLGIVILTCILSQKQRVVGIAIAAGHKPSSPAQRRGICGSQLRVELKAVASTLKQFPKQAFALGTL
jgi:hypothetical protein